jgi:hypothetical protein
MHLEAGIFESEKSHSEKGPRFGNQDEIQKALRQVCQQWLKCLLQYIVGTKRLFGHAELPWEYNERVIVSSLSSAITRSFPSSLIIEELPVDKDGTKSGNGRADLWASIPELSNSDQPFSFYCEAKKTKRTPTLGTLYSYLHSNYGILKILRDFRKSNSKRWDQRSTFGKSPNRKHAHYVIGMLAVRLKREKEDPTGKVYITEVKKELQKAVEEYMSTTSTGEDSAKGRRAVRKLDRFPTTALILEPTDEQHGMIALFTVLARSGFAKKSTSTSPRLRV